MVILSINGTKGDVNECSEFDKNIHSCLKVSKNYKNGEY